MAAERRNAKRCRLNDPTVRACPVAPASGPASLETHDVGASRERGKRAQVDQEPETG
jgi:hypothetical protein